MGWYAYCITEQQVVREGVRTRRPFPVAGIHGIGGAPVLGYPSGEFAVIVSEFSGDGRLDERAALEHARVVSACFRSSTVLPFRFGAVFDCEKDLRRAVRTNRRAFLDSVADLRGKSEMHLKLVVRDLPMPLASLLAVASAGNEYLTHLHQRAAREREAQTKARALSVQIHKLFNPLREEVCCKKVDAGGFSIDIAHLIDSKTLPQYQNRCTKALRQLQGCEVAITGPWPPYHFVPDKLRMSS